MRSLSKVAGAVFALALIADNVYGCKTVHCCRQLWKQGNDRSQPEDDHER